MTGKAVLALGLLLAFVWNWSAPRAAPPLASSAAPVTTDDRIRFPASAAPSLRLPDGSTRRVESLLAVHGRLRHGDFAWDARGVPPGRLWIWIDPRRQLLSVFRGGHEIGTALLLYGADGRPTPGGMFAILGKSEAYRSRAFDAPMPDALWLTRDGVAIHASNVREGAATHGCIGVPPEFARLLFQAAQVGDMVAIQPDR